VAWAEAGAAGDRTYLLGACTVEARVEAKGAARQIDGRPEAQAADEVLERLGVRLALMPISCQHKGSAGRQKHQGQKPGAAA
jgi:hypothetical protein